MPTVAPSQSSAVDTKPDAIPIGCDACGHPLASHDAISLRYCQATQAQALTRNCICP
jgi:hypothetical protein